MRELSRSPLPMDKLRFANDREEKATRFLSQNAVRVTSCTGDASEVLILQGSVQDKGKIYNPSLTIDSDQRIIQAECTCNWHSQNKLFKGPCEHILALKTQHIRQSR